MYRFLKVSLVRKLVLNKNLCRKQIYLLAQALNGLKDEPTTKLNFLQGD